jgi:hypothetical protein
LTAALVLFCKFTQASSPKVTVCEAPHIVLGEIPGFTSEEVAPSESELTILPGDTQFVKRKYTDGAGGWYLVTAVIGGTSKSSIHRPELCLPTQGFLMASSRTAEVAGNDWRFITLARGGVPAMGFAYTFFNQAGFRTASHTERILCDVFDRSFYNRIDRWVMITVNSSRSDGESIAAFVKRISEMLP